VLCTPVKHIYCFLKRKKNPFLTGNAFSVIFTDVTIQTKAIAAISPTAEAVDFLAEEGS